MLHVYAAIRCQVLKPRLTRFTRLVVTVPRVFAEAYGAALVEVGIGAVEERDAEALGTVEVVITLPDADSIDDWSSLAAAMYRAFAEQLGATLEECVIRREDCEVDYHAQWLEHLERQQLTDTIALVPTSDASDVPAGTRCIYFEPHPSFGDGSHPTTRLAARAVESFCREHPRCTMLDVGTGNGVLAFVAALSGAKLVLGIDIDEGAICTAQHNASLNHLDALCTFETTPLEVVDGGFDMVVANLEPRVQVELLESIVSRVAPGGALILTGFLVEQVDAVLQPLVALGFTRWLSAEASGYALEHWQSGNSRTGRWALS